MEQKHILLCVIGMTPQVITETLFALHMAQKPLPEEIHIVTTREGAERTRLTLLNDQWLKKFYQDYQIAYPGDTLLNIEVIKDSAGQLLKDIRSEQHNTLIANGITEKIRQLTGDANISLHVSIAGGRKTMGFYAGYALSLYGRPQDSLSHVLVSEKFESDPQFYYPTPYSRVIYARDNTPLDSQQAEVMLADIPFVRLRHGLDEKLLQGQSSFSETVARAQKNLAPPRLCINLKHHTMNAAGENIPLQPADWVFYLWILECQFTNKDVSCPPEGADNKEYAEQFIRCWHTNLNEMTLQERTEKTLQKGMSKGFFEQHKSTVNKTIENALSIHADSYQIHTYGKRGYSRYATRLEANQIEYQEE